MLGQKFAPGSIIKHTSLFCCFSVVVYCSWQCRRDMSVYEEWDVEAAGCSDSTAEMSSRKKTLDSLVTQRGSVVWCCLNLVGVKSKTKLNEKLDRFAPTKAGLKAPPAEMEVLIGSAAQSLCLFVLVSTSCSLGKVEVFMSRPELRSASGSPSDSFLF